jgi:hypothetical protein
MVKAQEKISLIQSCISTHQKSLNLIIKISKQYIHRKPYPKLIEKRNCNPNIQETR